MKRQFFWAGTLIVFFGTVGASAFMSGVAAAQDCSRAVDIEIDGDACAQYLAASVHGNASGTNCDGMVSCISLSGTGDASNTAGDDACGSGFPGVGLGCVAASGTGSASNSGGYFSCGFANFGVGVGCVAISGTGNASNSGGYAASCGVGVAGVGAGCIALSGAGNASNSAGGYSDLCGEGWVGLGAGCVAVSGTGSASNTGGQFDTCGHGYFGAGAGCIAMSGMAGGAANSAGGSACGLRVGGTIGVGCVALSNPAPAGGLLPSVWPSTSVAPVLLMWASGAWPTPVRKI